MESKHKIVIGILVAIILILAAGLAVIVMHPGTIQTDILDTKDCTLNASHFKDPINENGGFNIIDTASDTDILFSTVEKDSVDNIVDSWENGALTGRSYTIAGLNGLLSEDFNSKGLAFYFEKNGQYYMISAISSTEEDIDMESFRAVSVLSEFNEILTAWQKGMPDVSNVDIAQNDGTVTIDSDTSQTEAVQSSSQTTSNDNVREEDQITPDGWNPKEHEVSREPLDDGNERVNYDDGYFVIVDKDGNIITHGY
ncbi:hypothetical protein [Methanobrevibacter sp.]|uniref:hypothetical protein n=1 Tax=Methanobrevibacter sp. TaxID=66852 RepID=UPI00386A6168